MRPRKACTLLCCFFILFCSCLTGDIENPESAASNPQRYVLRVADSVGIELGNNDFVFGAVVLCTDSQGNILALDFIQRSVRKFTWSGEHLQTLFIEGSGPGEFMAPTDICSLPGGGFAVSSEIDRKLAFFDSSMEFIREIHNTSGSLMGPTAVQAVTDSAVVCSFHSFQGDSVSGVLSLNSSSLAEPDVILVEKKVSFTNNSSWQDETWYLFAAAPDGSVYASERTCFRWRIEHFSPDGSTLSVLEREYEPVPYTMQEMIHGRNTYLRRYLSAHGTDAGFQYTPPGYHFSIEQLFVDAQGRLWVESGGKTNSEFDVYSPGGDSLFHCSFHPPDWQLCDSWQVTAGFGGFLASPVNPECYPLLYMLELESY